LKAAENEVNQATDEHNSSTDTLTVRDQQRLLSGSVKDILTLRAYIVNAIRHKRHMVQLTENLLRVYDEYMQLRSARGLPDRPKEDRESSARILGELKDDIVFLEKSSKQVLDRMVEKDKETKSAKKENTQMGADDVDAEKIHEAAVDYYKFKDMPKLQTGEDSEEERDAKSAMYLRGRGKLSVIRKKRCHTPTIDHTDVVAVNNRRVSRGCGGVGDGSGMPQHMLRGSYFASGVNR
jgi:hypothetical protein